jgi:hypothetical protein
VDVYFMRARWYEPKTGRFLSEDPIGLSGGMNPLTYAGSDPINGRDPTGLCAEDEELWVRYSYYVDERGEEIVTGILGYYCMPKGGGRAGGPGPGRGTRVVGPQECPAPPIAPPGVDVNRNIRRASAMGNLPWAPLWFKERVRNNKEGRSDSWDYKQLGAIYQPFGNFNYAATGRALAWFSETGLARRAGEAQVAAGTSRPEWGTPDGGYPYGDDPTDQANITAGFQYFNNACHKK